VANNDVELDAKFGARIAGWRFSGFFFLTSGVGRGSTKGKGEDIIGDGGSMIGEDGGGELGSGPSTAPAAGADFFFFFGFFFFFFLATVCGASSSSTSSMVTMRPIPAVFTIQGVSPKDIQDGIEEYHLGLD